MSQHHDQFTIASTNGFSTRQAEDNATLTDGIQGNFRGITVIAQAPKARKLPSGFALTNIDEALAQFYAEENNDPGLRI